MKTMQVGELKAHFSEVIDDVKQGEEIVITRGRKRENVAVLIPYSTYKQKNSIKLGVLKDKVTVTFADDFEMDPSELLGE